MNVLTDEHFVFWHPGVFVRVCLGHIWYCKSLSPLYLHPLTLAMLPITMKARCTPAMSLPCHNDRLREWPALLFQSHAAHCSMASLFGMGYSYCNGAELIRGPIMANLSSLGRDMGFEFAVMAAAGGGISPLR